MNLNITYAQYNEDLILAALLHDVVDGFYVDVGANLPEQDSVTKYFYDKGWRGINIEPVPELYRSLVKARPNDINLNYGAGSKKDKLILREYKGGMHGHSTFSKEQKKQHRNEKFVQYEVEIKTLKDIFNSSNIKHIHFMKVDVEGFENEVIEGNDWEKYRPEVLCIEADHKNSDWLKTLENNGYKKFIFDGLNEYFLESNSMDRIKNFSERVSQLKHSSFPASKLHILDDIQNLRKMTKKQDQQLKKPNESIRFIKKPSSTFPLRPELYRPNEN